MSQEQSFSGDLIKALLITSRKSSLLKKASFQNYATTSLSAEYGCYQNKQLICVAHVICIKRLGQQWIKAVVKYQPHSLLHDNEISVSMLRCSVYELLYSRSFIWLTISHAH